METGRLLQCTGICSSALAGEGPLFYVSKLGEEPFSVTLPISPAQVFESSCLNGAALPLAFVTCLL